MVAIICVMVCTVVVAVCAEVVMVFSNGGDSLCGAAVESSFLTDMRNVDYMRASLSHTNPVRRSAEHVLRSAPETEMKVPSC